MAAALQHWPHWPCGRLARTHLFSPPCKKVPRCIRPLPEIPCRRPGAFPAIVFFGCIQLVRQAPALAAARQHSFLFKRFHATRFANWWLFELLLKQKAAHVATCLKQDSIRATCHTRMTAATGCLEASKHQMHPTNRSHYTGLPGRNREPSIGLCSRSFNPAFYRYWDVLWR